MVGNVKVIHGYTVKQLAAQSSDELRSLLESSLFLIHWRYWWHRRLKN